MSMKEDCLEALKKAPGTPAEIAAVIGDKATANLASAALSALYFDGFTDRKNIGTGKTAVYRYTLNDPPKPKRKRKKPAPIPRAKRTETAATPIVKPKVATTSPKVAKPAKTPLLASEPSIEGMLDVLAKSFADQIVKRIVSHIEIGLKQQLKR